MNKTIIILGACLVFVLGLYVATCNRKQIEPPYEEIKLLKQELDSLKQQQQQYATIDSVKTEALKKKMKADSLALSNLKKKTDEKKRHIDTAGNDELRRLLAD
jgi:Tfp pilus assembly protein PilN